jgi:Peptidase family M28/PDZ domain
MFTRIFYSICIVIFAATQIVAQSIQLPRIQKDITFLASDKLKGRGTGTKEELKAAKYLAKQMKKAGLTPKGDKGTYFAKFGFRKAPNNPHGTERPSDGEQVYSQNVVGYLDNGAEYTVIIGGHYDHLGMGHDHNSLDAEPDGKIHNGADDNASGTAGVIELARVLAGNGKKERYNYLFMCFSGEELGLVGSKRFTEYPTIDITKVHYMINMDMIGRLTPEKGLVVGGVGTAPDFVPMLSTLQFPHKIKQDSAGVGPSDHTSFYLKNIPVLFFFTGQHSDYHKPTDDVEFIQLEGVGKVLSYVLKAIETLDSKPRLVFQETKSKESDNVKFTVTLGIMPDYTFDGKGVHIDAVREGKPASTAGILKNDVITKLGGIEVSDVQGYMKVLATYKKGDKAMVTVLRGAEVKEYEVEF